MDKNREMDVRKKIAQLNMIGGNGSPILKSKDIKT
jgi:hypothetical protein